MTVFSYSSLYFTHNFIFLLILIIGLFTLLILFIICSWRIYYSFFSSWLVLEYFWTIFPLIIVILLFIPLIFISDLNFYCNQSYFCLANQWYWEISSTTLVLNRDFEQLINQLNPNYSGAAFLNLVSNSFSLFYLSSTDVLHSFGLNSLMVKIDCVPGLIHNLIFNFPLSGTYLAYCTELCGVNHSNMPFFFFIV